MQDNLLDTPWVIKKGWMKKEATNYWSKMLHQKLEWQQPSITLYGREHLIPRKTVFLSNPSISYKYSGLIQIGTGWPHWFLPLLKKMRNYCGQDFNGCLLNLYSTGQDSMGWHKDNEPELDPFADIASLSIGASRDFKLRNLCSGAKTTLCLANGDLLIMKAPCQENWQHSLPKRKNVKDLRINLTFRCYLKSFD